MTARRPLRPSDPVSALRRFYADELNLYKDAVHERLQGLLEQDQATGCWAYTGAWDAANGQARVRVGAKTYLLTRVAAWLYVEGFELWSDAVVVRSCQLPCCFNPEHLVVAADRAAAFQLLRGLGVYKKFLKGG